MKVRGCCHQIKQKALKCSGVAVLIPQPDFQISPPFVAAEDPSSRIHKVLIRPKVCSNKLASWTIRESVFF